MKKAIVPTPEKCRLAEINATLSSCCGVLGEVTLTDSAVIILFAGMLGAGDMFSMMTTSILPLFNGLFVIPMAWLATRLGSRRLIIRACSLSAIAYFLTVGSPFFERYSVAALIGTLVLFAFCLTGFIAGWFPMLDSFLTSERRTSFFSTMRFSHQLTSVVFLFLVGFAIGKDPPIWKLQIILLLGAIIFMGRLFFISRIPIFATQKKDTFGFKYGLMTAIGNKSLAGFSVYLFVLNLAAYGTIPLMTIYLKNYLNAPDNIIVMISAVTLFGMLLGYFSAVRIIEHWGLKKALLGFHLSYALVNLALFFISNGNHLTYVLITVLLLIYSFTIAASSIVSSSEMMAMATPGNKTMAMAFCGAFTYGGSGFSRLISSLLLGSGLLAPEWHLGVMKVCHYQTLFLIYALAIIFAAVLLVLVPAIFPQGEYTYNEH
jgi:MFS family permease